MQNTSMKISTTTRNPQRFTLVLPLLLLATLLLHGCAVKRPVQSPEYPKTPTYPESPATPVPPTTPTTTPRPVTVTPDQTETIYTPKTGPAGSLYRQATASISAGDYDKAELTLERALRIEPRNGHYWYAMAQVKYQQQQYSQTIHLCLKSKSFAGKNDQLRHLNDSLILKARQQLKE
jgi:hypothetical protein